MTQAATNADIAYNTSTNTLSATNFSGTLLGNATGLQGTPSITVQDVAAEKVSIAGTISYEDVTNVNSVGIITANKGIKVPNYGMTVTGVVTATSYQGDGSSLTGVESGVSNFVASGVIPNGSTVIIKSDGTVTGIATVGAATTFSPSPTNYSGTEVCENHIAAYDTAQNKVVILYKGQTGSYSQAVVGTVSGTTITFGTPVQAADYRPSYHDVCYDVNSGKIVYCYKDNGDSNKGKVLIGTVSGTGTNATISFGSKVTFDSGDCSWMEVAYDANAKKVVIAYSLGSSYIGKAIVGTVAGTSISFGSVAEFYSNRTYGKDVVYHEAAQKVVIFYKDGTNGDKGKAIVGTVSGTSISFGSVAEFEPGGINSTWLESAYDPINEKVVVAYQDEGNSDYGTANVGDVSGTSITFGTPQVFSTESTQHLAVVYDVNAAKTIIVYNKDTSGKIRESTLNGTTIVFGDEVTWTTISQEYPGAAYNTAQGATVIGFKNPANSGRGSAIVYKADQISTNLTAENYIGLAAEAIANGATGKITTVGGINSGQTGLTAAQTYYVQIDGSLGTSADNPSVVAGTAVSNTKVLVWKS